MLKTLSLAVQFYELSEFCPVRTFDRDLNPIAKAASCFRTLPFVPSVEIGSGKNSCSEIAFKASFMASILLPGA